MKKYKFYFPSILSKMLVCFIFHAFNFVNRRQLKVTPVILLDIMQINNIVKKCYSYYNIFYSQKKRRQFKAFK